MSERAKPKSISLMLFCCTFTRQRGGSYRSSGYCRSCQITQVNEVNRCRAPLILGRVTVNDNRYATNHPDQLSLAIPPWPGSVSTSEGWAVIVQIWPFRKALGPAVLLSKVLSGFVDDKSHFSVHNLSDTLTQTRPEKSKGRNRLSTSQSTDPFRPAYAPGLPLQTGRFSRHCFCPDDFFSLAD